MTDIFDRSSDSTPESTPGPTSPATPEPTPGRRRLGGTPVRSQAELAELWRELLGPLGFAEHTIWVMFIGADDRPLPQLTQIEEAVAPPDRQGVESFAAFLGHMACELGASPRPGLRVALLRSRPGGGSADADDRAWASRLLAACRMAAVPAEVVHLATEDVLMPLPWDELASTGLPWTA